jgi:hypothetical protein
LEGKAGALRGMVGLTNLLVSKVRDSSRDEGGDWVRDEVASVLRHVSSKDNGGFQQHLSQLPMDS